MAGVWGENLRFILGNILLIQFYLRKNYFFKNLREICVIFYDFLFLQLLDVYGKFVYLEIY